MGTTSSLARLLYMMQKRGDILDSALLAEVISGRTVQTRDRQIEQPHIDGAAYSPLSSSSGSSKNHSGSLLSGSPL